MLSAQADPALLAATMAVPLAPPLTLGSDHPALAALANISCFAWKQAPLVFPLLVPTTVPSEDFGLQALLEVVAEVGAFAG